MTQKEEFPADRHNTVKNGTATTSRLHQPEQEAPDVEGHMQGHDVRLLEQLLAVWGLFCTLIIIRNPQNSIGLFKPL